MGTTTTINKDANGGLVQITTVTTPIAHVDLQAQLDIANQQLAQAQVNVTKITAQLAAYTSLGGK